MGLLDRIKGNTTTNDTSSLIERIKGGGISTSGAITPSTFEVPDLVVQPKKIVEEPKPPTDFSRINNQFIQGPTDEQRQIVKDRIAKIETGISKEAQRKKALAGGEERLQQLLEENERLQTQPEFDFNKEKALTEDILKTRNLISANQPGFKTGVREGLGLEPTAQFGAQLATPERAEAKQLATEEARSQKGFTTGRVVTEIGKQAALYATVGSALKGTEFFRQLGQKFGGGKVATFAADQIADLFVDAVIQTPQEVLRGDTLETIGMNRLLDIGMNLGIGAAGEYFKSLKNADSKGFEKAVSVLTPEEASKVRNAIGADINIPLRQSIETPQIQAVRGAEVATQPQVGPIRDLSTTVDNAVNNPLINKIKGVEPTTQAAKIEGVDDVAKTTFKLEDIADDVSLDDLLNKKGGTQPIKTSDRLLLETPEIEKKSIKDKILGIYQETFNQAQSQIQAGAKKELVSNRNRASSNFVSMIKNNQIDMDGRAIGESVEGIFSTVPKEQKEALFDLAFNKHNIDRYREGKPIFRGDDVFKTVTPEQSQQTIDRILSEFPGLDETSNKIVKYFNNNLNEWAVKSGLVSEDNAKFLTETYPSYVPTNRPQEYVTSMGGKISGSNYLKKAKGSTKDIMPLDQQMVLTTEKLVRDARKNEVMVDMYNSFKNGEAGRYIEDVIDLPGGRVDNLLDVGKSFDEPSLVKENKYVLNFYDKGQPKQMVVNKNLYDSFRQLDSEFWLNKIADGINKHGTQNMKELITGKNPLFTISNMARDSVTALLFSDNPLKMVANMPKAVVEMLTNSPRYQQFKALGGASEGLTSSGRQYKVPNLNSKSSLKKIGEQVSKVNPITKVGQLNDFIEQLPRYAEFVSVLEKTNNPALAIYKSAELTTDFARHGKSVKSADRVVPYLNPSFQGLDRITRQIIDKPLQTAVRGTAMVGVPSLILDQINKDDEAFNNLPARERNMYYQIPFTDENGERKFIRVPKSRETGFLFSNLFEWAARKLRGEEVTFEEIGDAFSESFKPVGISESNIFVPISKALKQIANPDSVQTNFWDAPIIPYSQQKYSPGQQYDERTSGFAKKIGEAVNVSPYVIDYLLTSYGGIVGQTVKPIGASSTPDNSLATIAKSMFDKKFITDPVFKDASVSKFYDLLDKNKTAAQDLNKEKLSLDLDYQSSDEVTDLEKKANSQNKVAIEISNLSKAIKKLSTQKDKEKEMRKLRKEINAKAAKALEDFK